jgi:hypothetical protein
MCQTTILPKVLIRQNGTERAVACLPAYRTRRRWSDRTSRRLSLPVFGEGPPDGANIEGRVQRLNGKVAMLEGEVSRLSRAVALEVAERKTQ